MLTILFYSSMERITVSELPDLRELHIDVDIELFMNSERAGDLFVRLTEIAMKWQSKEPWIAFWYLFMFFFSVNKNCVNFRPTFIHNFAGLQHMTVSMGWDILSVWCHHHSKDCSLAHRLSSPSIQPFRSKKNKKNWGRSNPSFVVC